MFLKPYFWLRTRKNLTEDVTCSVLQDSSDSLITQHLFACITFFCSVESSLESSCPKHHLRIAVSAPCIRAYCFLQQVFPPLRLSLWPDPFLEMELEKCQSGVGCAWDKTETCQSLLGFLSSSVSGVERYISCIFLPDKTPFLDFINHSTLGSFFLQELYISLECRPFYSLVGKP